MRSAWWGCGFGWAAHRVVDKYIRKQLDPETKKSWERKNFAGNTVSLVGGVKLAAASVSGALLLREQPAVAGAHLLATGTGAVLGYVDDLQLGRKNSVDQGAGKDCVSEAERVVVASSAAKGFHGHLNALKKGQVTTGFLKIIGIGSGAAMAAALLAVARQRETRCALPVNLLHWGVDTALIAGSANLANLFDLRPGRALKVATLVAVPLASGKNLGTVSAATALGSIGAALPADLAAREMLGDTGANALGAHLGVAAAIRLPLGRKLAALTGVGALTVASEKVSFSQVIAANPLLNRFDQWGRPTLPA